MATAQPVEDDEVQLAVAEATDAALSAERLHEPVPPWATAALVLGADAVAAAAVLAALGLWARSPWGALTAAVALLAGAVGGRRVSDTRLVAARGTLDEVPGLLGLALLASFCGALGAGVAGEPAWDAARLATTLAGLGVASALARALAVRVLRALVGPERCLVVGDPEDRAHLLRQLDAASVTHLQIVAGIGVPALGRGGDGLPTLEELLELHAVDRVVVLPGAHPDREAQAARRARNAGARVTVAPRTLAAIGERVRVERVGASVLLSVHPAVLSLPVRALKRGLDVTGAAAGLVALAPVMLAIAAAIRLTSTGPALFWQERIGLAGERFRIAKFRTMVIGAEALKDELRARNEAGGGLFKIADDPRVTRIGRLLRRTSLDELPQLINVLRGEMSLVGPRPLVGDEDELIQGWYRDRLRLKPGMTGAWQVMGSARIPLHEMVALDHQYVAGWSLWLDVRILLRTVVFVVRRRGI